MPKARGWGGRMRRGGWGTVSALGVRGRWRSGGIMSKTNRRENTGALSLAGWNPAGTEMGQRQTDSTVGRPLTKGFHARAFPQLKFPGNGAEPFRDEWWLPQRAAWPGCGFPDAFSFFSPQNRATPWGTCSLTAVTSLPGVLQPIPSGLVAREPPNTCRSMAPFLHGGAAVLAEMIYKRAGKTLSPRPGG